VKGLEIEFTDGEKRVIEGNLRAHVKDNVLHVEHVRGAIGFNWYDDAGAYPIVNIKFYHWIE
jgi:hypothetical protein